MMFVSKIYRSLRSTALLTGAFLASAALTGTAFAADGLYSVQLNKTEILRLPAAASAVIVGNPEIADVSIHSSRTILVVGKGYGETNLLIFDADGNTMMSSDIQVITPASRNQVRIFNANQGRQTFNCGPSCNPSPTLGDSKDFVENNKGDFGGDNALTELFAAAAGSTLGGDAD